MKYLKRYNENTNYEDMGEVIKDILLDISDDGYNVFYNLSHEDDRLKGMFQITISTFNDYKDNLHFTKHKKLEWSKISDTIHRIESYLNDFNFNYKWEIWVYHVDRWDFYSSLSEVDGSSSEEYQINIEIV